MYQQLKSMHDSEHNDSYDPDQFEKQSLQQILEMYKPIEREYAQNTGLEQQKLMIGRFIDS